MTSKKYHTNDFNVHSLNDTVLKKYKKLKKRDLDEKYENERKSSNKAK